ncbi:MAG: hypothetical protein GEU73_07625 [Chloroflexi bacterium]|nr:hypothetical protein [Chloroflexota bacterium]
MALCTQEDVEHLLQAELPPTDPTVAKLIDYAQALIEAEVAGKKHRTLESAAQSETFDGRVPQLFLTAYPVTAVTSVVEDGETLVEDDDYRWYENGRLIRLTPSGNRRYWKGKAQAIEVSYTGGFLSPDHDRQLNHLGMLCATVVARAFKRGEQTAAIPPEAGAVQSISLPDSGSVTYAVGSAEFQGGSVAKFVTLDEDERRQLIPYRRTWLGFS